MAYEQDQNDLITKQFAGMRKQGAARMEEAKRQNAMALARNANASGGFGGAEQKLQDESNRQLQESFAANDAGIGAQEAQARMGVKEAERGREFAREERLGSEQTARYFFDTEFKENQKTNLINAVIALKKSKFFDKENDEMENFFKSGFGDIYGGVASRDMIPPPPQSGFKRGG